MFGFINTYPVPHLREILIWKMYVFRGYRICSWIFQSENAGITFQSLVSWFCQDLQGLKIVVYKTDKENISVFKTSRICVVGKEKV